MKLKQITRLSDLMDSNPHIINQKDVRVTGGFYGLDGRNKEFLRDAGFKVETVQSGTDRYTKATFTCAVVNDEVPPELVNFQNVINKSDFLLHNGGYGWKVVLPNSGY